MTSVTSTAQWWNVLRQRQLCLSMRIPDKVFSAFRRGGRHQTHQEWRESASDLRGLVDVIKKTYPSLGSAQPCYYDDDHMNQLGWLKCTECHPSSSTSVNRQRTLWPRSTFRAIETMYRYLTLSQ